MDDLISKACPRKFRCPLCHFSLLSPAGQTLLRPKLCRAITHRSLTSTHLLRHYGHQQAHRLIHDVQKRLWVERVNQSRVAGHLTSWISSLHPEKLECRVDCNFLNGPYNLCQKLRFCDATTWLLRMLIIGSVCDKYADEKIAMEVEVLNLLRDRNIPVPASLPGT